MKRVTIDSSRIALALTAGFFVMTAFNIVFIFTTLKWTGVITSGILGVITAIVTYLNLKTKNADNEVKTEAAPEGANKPAYSNTTLHTGDIELPKVDEARIMTEVESESVKSE